MTLDEMVDPHLLNFNVNAESKDDVIEIAAEMMLNAGRIFKKEDFKKAIYEREEQISTGMGMGIAIPHCHSDAVKETSLALLKLKKEIDWDSLDEEPVRFVILLAVPIKASNDFLELLSTFSYNLMDDDFREGLMNAGSIEDVKKIFIGLEI